MAESNHTTGAALDVTAAPDVARMTVSFPDAEFTRHLSEVLGRVQETMAEMGRTYARGMNAMFLRQAPSPLRGSPIRTGGLDRYPNRAAHRRALKMASYKRRQMRKHYGTDKIPTLAARPWRAILIRHAHVTHRHEWVYDADAR